MQQLINVYKPLGMTPLEVIRKLKQTNSYLTEAKISYAGRLDPLAHGVLLLLVGENTKEKDRYLALPKTYEFEIIFGLQTDTYDLLGYATQKYDKPIKNVNLFVNTFIKNHTGKQVQAYPPYSSRTVNGKPLFWYARNDKLNELTIPKHEIEIFSFTCLSIGKISLQKLKKQTFIAVSSVKGDFRQEEIIKRWNELFMKNKTNAVFPTAKFCINCSSGTYIRELTHLIGQELGCGAVALDILRINIGDYSVNDSLRV